MRRRLAASALFGLGILAVAATAQPPATDTKPKLFQKKEEKDDKAAKKADPLDGLIGAALVHDADVQVARAKVQLAEAELVKARQTVTLKVTTLSTEIANQKRAIETATPLFQIKERAWKEKTGSFADYAEARERYEAVQAKLAQLETEMKLLTGGSHKASADGWDDLAAVHRNTTWQASCMACHTGPAVRGANDAAVEKGLAWFTHRMNGEGRASAAAALAGLHPAPLKGPVADRLRAALDKPVKLGAKGNVIPLDKAMEVFKKEAGLDVTMRTPPHIVEPFTVRSEGEELPVGAWLQLFQDDSNGRVIYVREYGLLLTEPKAAPPDAVTITDFWKRKPEAKKGEEPKK
jgi:hypothetical protein